MPILIQWNVFPDLIPYLKVLIKFKENINNIKIVAYSPFLILTLIYLYTYL